MDTIAFILVGLFCSALGGRVEIAASEESGKSTHNDSMALVALAALSNLSWLPIVTWGFIHFQWYWGVGGMIAASIICTLVIKKNTAASLWDYRHFIRGTAVCCAVTLWLSII